MVKAFIVSCGNTLFIMDKCKAHPISTIREAKKKSVLPVLPFSKNREAAYIDALEIDKGPQEWASDTLKIDRSKGIILAMPLKKMKIKKEAI